ncbi:Region-like protein isoform 1 [Dorcoceras hygrometricum]|uniref:Region-like protein isoform 1 n=1 Tax=Dorcoceras hygrometricum TaxID=472368 RepID=A0A2Z7CAZ8_9LAMI|nr:Region-like protein isoform 1 [Dorcoceras hygrometricum]
MLRLVPAGGFACVCLLVVQQKQMSTWVNIPVARSGNVVISLLRLGVQLRVIFSVVACCWYFARASDWMTIGYPRMSASGESSTTMHRLLHASGSHPLPSPNDPNWFVLNQLVSNLPPISGQIMLLSYSSSAPIKRGHLELVQPLTETSHISQLTSQLVLQLVAQLSSSYCANDLICTRSLRLYLASHSITALVLCT